MLERMSHDHIGNVAKIHETSWGKNELSVKFGKKYIEFFYKNIVESEHSFAFVFLIDDKVIGYATGFYDYHGFNVFIKKKDFCFLFMTLIRKLVLGTLNFGDLINILKDDKKIAKAKYPKYHLGAIALSNAYKGTQIGKQAVNGTIGAVLFELESKGYPGCSGLCDLINIPMRKYFIKFGFEEIDIIKMIGRSVVLYEKTFRP